MKTKGQPENMSMKHPKRFEKQTTRPGAVKRIQRQWPRLNNSGGIRTTSNKTSEEQVNIYES